VKKKSLIREAMRELGRRRAAKLTVKQRQEIARKGGQARWQGMSKAEQRKLIERMVEARRKKKPKEKL
jgi:general stress protein YciG